MLLLLRHSHLKCLFLLHHSELEVLLLLCNRCFQLLLFVALFLYLAVQPTRWPFHCPLSRTRTRERYGERPTTSVNPLLPISLATRPNGQCKERTGRTRDL